MSWFGDFAGGAAEAGGGIIQRQINSNIELDRQQQLAKYNDELAQAKAQALRDMNAKTAQNINDQSDQVRLQRIADIINQKNGTSIGVDDVKNIASNPEALKAYGIDDRTRAQEYDDKVKAAEGLGALDHAKELRTQQDMELRRDAEERRGARAEAQTAAAAAETARKSKHDEAMEKLAERRVDAMFAKINAGGSNGQKAERVMSYIDSQRKSVTAEAQEVSRAMNEELKNNKFATPAEVAEIKKSYEPKLKEISRKRAQLDADFAEVRNRFGLSGLVDDEDGGKGSEKGGSATQSTPSQSPPANRPPLDSFKK